MAEIWFFFRIGIYEVGIVDSRKDFNFNPDILMNVVTETVLEVYSVGNTSTNHSEMSVIISTFADDKASFHDDTFVQTDTDNISTGNGILLVKS